MEQDHGEQLYQKAWRELQQYRRWLLSLPKEEILSRAYGYAMREDILLSLENVDLTPEQQQTLLRMPDVLENVYKRFDKCDCTYMDVMQACIEETADLYAEKFREKEQGVR